jgi:hypothetical protein
MAESTTLPDIVLVLQQNETRHNANSLMFPKLFAPDGP